MRVLVALLLCVFLGSALPDNVPAQEWTAYPPITSVQALAPGLDGAMWIGTNDSGVIGFDGTFATRFTLSNSDLPNSFVRAVTTTPDGRTWAGFYGEGGLASFDGTGWTTRTSADSDLPGDLVWALHTTDDGSIWIGTDQGGAARFDPETETFVEFVNASTAPWPAAPADPSIVNAPVSAVDTDPDGRVWIGSGGSSINGAVGLFASSSSGWLTFQAGDGGQLPDWWIHDIDVAPDGTVLAGTGNGLVEWSAGSVAVSLPGSANVPGQTVWAVLGTTGGEQWIGTNAGVAYSESGTWTVATEADGLALGQIFALEEDSSGNIWIGAERGLACYGSCPAAMIFNAAPTRSETAPSEVALAQTETDLALADVFSDADADVLSFEVSSSAPQIVDAGESGGVLTLRLLAEGAATIKVTARDGRGGGITWSFVAGSPASVSVEETETPSFLLDIYPNPSRGRVAIQVAGGPARIEVFDILGRRLHAVQSSALTLDALVPGVYLIRAERAGTSTGRLLTVH